MLITQNKNGFYCPYCQNFNRTKMPFNAGMFFGLTVLTMGFYIFIWVIQDIFSMQRSAVHGGGGFRLCEKCGRKIKTLY